MAGNAILTDDIITKECLRELKNQLVFSKSVNRGYDDQFGNGVTRKVGDTINIRKPSRYTTTTGAVLEIQDSVDKSIALQLDQHEHVGLAFSQKDLTLSVANFKERYIKPAVTALANKIDYSGYQAMYKAVSNSVGVPSASALPSTLKGFGQAYAKIAARGGSVERLTAVIDPFVQSSMVEGLKGLMQSSEQIAQQYEKGVMGVAAGMKFKMSQNVAKHTAGAPAGTPAIKTTITAQGASTIDADGITGSITGCYKAGDVIEIAGVYSVNPQTRQSTGKLMQFVVTATTNSASNEIASLPISPAIYSSGQYQNVDALPVDGAAITLFGAATTYASVVAPQNLVFAPEAFVLAMAEIELPEGMAIGSRATDPESGLSVALVRAFDPVNYRTITRLDAIWGWKCVYEEMACRVVGEPA